MCKVVVNLNSLVTIAEAALGLQRLCEGKGSLDMVLGDNTNENVAKRIAQAIDLLVDEPCHCAETIAIIEQRGRSPICPACGGRCSTMYDDVSLSGDDLGDMTTCDRCGLEILQTEASDGFGEWTGGVLCSNCCAVLTLEQHFKENSTDPGTRH